MTNKLSEISAKEIRAYLDQVLKTGSRATYERKLASLGKFFAWAKKEAHLATNPIEEYLSQETGSTPQPVKKTFYSSLQSRILAKFSNRPKLQDLLYKAFYTRPNWYQTYHSVSITNYFHIAILVIFCMAISFGVYDQAKSRAQLAQAYPASPTVPNRYLSFQGRLTNQYGNPITVATDLVFKLYDDPTAGSTLWNAAETACSITPDQDGIFSTLLGSTCGAAIANSVFSENAQVYLGVKAGADAEATPRVQIATVAYALNSETLQGLPAGTGPSNIPFIDSTGKLSIAAASPTIESTSGTFAITSQALTISSADTTNGAISITPDGTGTLNLTFEGAAPGGGAGGFVNATDANLTSGALYYGSVASNATGYDLLQLQSGSSLTTKFSVDNAGKTYIAGNVGIGTTAPGAALEVNGQVKITGGTPGVNKFLMSDADGLATWSTIASGIAADSLDFAQFEDTLDLDANLILNQSTYTWTQNFTGDTTTGLTYNANSLTSGSALAVASTGTAVTGDLATITLSGSNAANTGSLLSLTNSGTSNANTSLYIKHYATGTGNYAMRVDDVSGDTSPFVIDGTGNVGIGTTAPVGRLDVTDTSNTAASFSLTNNTATSIGAGVNTLGVLDLQSTSLTTGNLMNLEVNALTTGTALNVTSTSTGLLTTAGGLFKMVATGNPGASWVGSLGLIDYATSTDADIDGSALKVAISGAGAGDGTVLNITSAQTGTSAFALRVNDDGTYTDSTPFVIDVGGNVGIGTATPDTKLNVVDTSQSLQMRIGTVTAGLSPLVRFSGRNTGNTTSYHGDIALDAENGIFTLYAPGTSAPTIKTLNINTTGNVGIGTTAPAVLLDVVSSAPILQVDASGATSAPAIIQLDADRASATAISGQLKFFNNGATPIAEIRALRGSSDTAGDLQLVTANAVVAHFDENGNVGIGTTAPTANLHILKSVTGQATFLKIQNTRGGTNDEIDLDFENATSDVATARIGTIRTNRAVGGDSDLIFSTYSNSALGERMRIMDSGNVGIGTTGPSFKLEVAGDIGPEATNTRNIGSASRVYNTIYVNNIVGTGSLGYWQRNGTALSPATITDSVGIGTTNPLDKLTISSSGTTDIGIFKTSWSSGNEAILRFRHGDGTGDGSGNGAQSEIRSYLPGGGDSDLHFYTTDNTTMNSAPTMVITGNGNVGIGTTSPTGILQTGSDLSKKIVFGRYSAGAPSAIFTTAEDGTHYQFQNNNGNVILGIIDTGTLGGVTIGGTSFGATPPAGGLLVDGNVGIGTTGPSYKLDVADKIAITSTDPALVLRETDQTLPAGLWRIDSTSGDMRFVLNLAVAGDFSSGLIPMRIEADVPASNLVHLTSGGVMLAETTGNVGIGTTAPASILNTFRNSPGILSTALFQNYGTSVGATYGSMVEIGGIVGGGTANIWQLQNSPGGAPYFGIANTSTQGTAATPSMVITTGGNVGIGTTGPGAPLEVVGQTRLTSGNAAGALRIGADVNANTLSANTRKIGRITIPTYTDATVNSFVLAGDNSSGANGVYIGGYPGASIYAATDIHFLTVANATTNGGTERLGIDSSGNFNVNSGQMYVQQSSGNVGIGTTGPASKLHVYGTSPTLKIDNSSTATLNTLSFSEVGTMMAYIQYRGTTNAVPNILNIGTYSAGGQLKFDVAAGSEAMRINSSGNVGIGTTAPGAKLDVLGGRIIQAGSAAITGYLHTNSGNLASVTSLNPGILLFGLTTGAQGNYYGMDLGSDGTTYRTRIFSGQDISFAKATNITPTTQSNFTELMVIKNSGNVGIGTTSPNEKLEVNGNIRVGNSDANYYTGYAGNRAFVGYKTSANALILQGDSARSITFNINDTFGSGEVMRINTSGNVGIGTTGPGAKLVVTGGATRIGDTADGLQLYYGTGYGEIKGIDINAGGYNDIRFTTSATPGMILTTDGNVGVGTTAPVSLLSVGASSQFQVDSNGDIVKLKNLTYSWPSSHTASGFLQDNGSGTLSWTTTVAATSVAFNNITSGSNTTANMSVGTGAALNYAGSGTINASSLIGATWAAPGTIGSSTPNTGAFTTLTSTGNSYFAATSGNVGIGTTSPGFRLDVLSASSGSWATKIYNSHATAGYGLEVRAGNDATNKIAEFRDVNDAAKVTILGNGNVGIGTTSPLAKLHVEGSCVTGDTILPIRRRRRGKSNNLESEDEWDYLLCRIDEILPGDEVLSLNEFTGALEYAKINKLMDMDIKEVYELTTKSGRVIRTTENHPYLTLVKENPVVSEEIENI